MINLMDPNLIDGNESVAHELKLLCGVWEHCADGIKYSWY